MQKKKTLKKEIKKPKEVAPVNKPPVEKKTVQEQINEAGGNKDNIIALIKSWLPHGIKKASIRFAGDKMYLALLDKDDKDILLPPQKLNVFFKFALTRNILKLTSIREYEFIECKIDFINNTMSGVQYFIKDNVKYKKSFNV
jgi:hypothetical protein